MSEDFQLEIEALTSVYSDSLEIVQQPEKIIKAHIQPRVDKEQDIYVMMQLDFIIDDDYPESAPQITIRNFKGLADEDISEVGEKLRQEAVEYQGDLIIGQLIELAIDELDKLNFPKGRCCFCLEDMVDAESHAHKRLIRMPCFHTFHFECFQDWWKWQQQILYNKEKQVVEELGSYEFARISKKLPVKEGDTYTSFCPVCRLSLPLSQIPYSNEFQMIVNKNGNELENGSGDMTVVQNNSVLQS
eukprot:TRINITY_DN545_c0_g1_i1.p1 TRINITY_DN545_c0_g1~~TRINITY_DN545_c0_g1_i1.p1  ORF type:complete len:245 (+),score=16.34 TRINITY_DN545_c0_g1_i1:137-871(+)